MLGARIRTVCLGCSWEVADRIYLLGCKQDVAFRTFSLGCKRGVAAVAFSFGVANTLWLPDRRCFLGCSWVMAVRKVLMGCINFLAAGFAQRKWVTDLFWLPDSQVHYGLQISFGYAAAFSAFFSACNASSAATTSSG